MAKIGTIFFNYLQFFVFFWTVDKFRWPIIACLLLCERLDTLLAGNNFSLCLGAFVILKNFQNFQFFSQSCL